MSPQQSLNTFPSGATVRVEGFCSRAEGACRCRLCAMGLTPGAEADVVDVGDGMCRIAVRGSQITLSSDVAELVRCVPRCERGRKRRRRGLFARLAGKLAGRPAPAAVNSDDPATES